MADQLKAFASGINSSCKCGGNSDMCCCGAGHTCPCCAGDKSTGGKPFKDRNKR